MSLFSNAYLLETVGAIWAQYPEQRLGQLLLNATRVDGATNKQALWNATNDELMDALVHMERSENE